jgi:hypothetical protein
MLLSKVKRVFALLFVGGVHYFHVRVRVCLSSCILPVVAVPAAAAAK